MAETKSAGIFGGGFDLAAAISKLFGNKAADVYPQLDNVVAGQATPSIFGGVSGTDATELGGSKYADTTTSPTSTPNMIDTSKITNTYTGDSNVTPLNQVGIDAINSSLGQLDTVRDQGLATEKNKYNSLIDRYSDEATQNQNKYDADLLTTNKNHAKNLMQSLYAGIGGLGSLLSIIRGQGAGSGTARDLVENAVGSQTARDIAGGDQTREDNTSALDNFINTFLSKDENRRREAELTLENNQNAIRSNELSQRQELLNNLAKIYGDAGRTADAQKYAADAISLNPRLTSLSNRGVAEYSPVDAAVQAPTLTSFAGPSTGGVTASGGAGNLGAGVFTLGDFRKRLQSQGV